MAGSRRARRVRRAASCLSRRACKSQRACSICSRVTSVSRYSSIRDRPWRFDLTDGRIQEIDVTGTTNFQALTGQLAGQQATIILEADGSGPHTLSFPAGWRFVGSAAPATIASSKVATLEIWTESTTDAAVICRYTVEP